MFMLTYHFFWTVVFTCCVPIALLSGNRRFLERFALKIPSTSLGSGNIWIHALSVGEVISAVPLVDAMGRQYPDKDIVFTVATAKGMAVAQKELQGKVRALITMPVDAWWCVHRLARVIRPAVFVLVETDIWPGQIRYFKKIGISTVLINGRISPKTFKSYLRVPCIVKKMYEHVTLCLMQSELDSERLLEAGVGPAKKVITVGNIKFDRDRVPMDEEERRTWLDRLAIDSDDTIWVAGSTHPGEEKVLLNVYKRLYRRFPSLRLVIAPRNIGQSTEILDLAKDLGLRACLKTELGKRGLAHQEVLILDTIGELGRIYGLAEVSFVGGSLVPFGGHNLLEPAVFGCPVIFGPHTHNFVLMSELLIKAGGGRRINDETGLFNAIHDLLSDSATRTRMGRAAKDFVEENRGALERVVSYIGGCI